jgi:hypothetical protein
VPLENLQRCRPCSWLLARTGLAMPIADAGQMSCRFWSEFHRSIRYSEKIERVTNPAFE